MMCGIIHTEKSDSKAIHPIWPQLWVRKKNQKRCAKIHTAVSLQLFLKTGVRAIFFFLFVLCLPFSHFSLGTEAISKCSGFGCSPDSITGVNALMKYLPINICVCLCTGTWNSMIFFSVITNKLPWPSEPHSLSFVYVLFFPFS